MTIKDYFKSPAPMSVDEDVNASTQLAEFKALGSEIRNQLNALAAKNQITLTCGQASADQPDELRTTKRFQVKSYLPDGQIQLVCECEPGKGHTTTLRQAFKALAKHPDNNNDECLARINSWSEQYETARAPLSKLVADAKKANSTKKTPVKKPSAASSSDERGRTLESDYDPERSASRNSSRKRTRLEEMDELDFLDDDMSIEDQLRYVLAERNRLRKQVSDLKRQNTILQERNVLLEQELQEFKSDYAQAKSTLSSHEDRLAAMEAKLLSSAGSDSITVAPDTEGPSWSQVAARPAPAHVKPVIDSEKSARIQEWAKEICSTKDKKNNPIIWDKLCFRHSGSKRLKGLDAVEKRMLLKALLEKIGIAADVAMYSCVGRSVMEIYFPLDKREEIENKLKENCCELIDINANVDVEKTEALDAAAKRIAFLFKLKDVARLQACVITNVHDDIMERVKKLIPSTDITRVLRIASEESFTQ